MRDKLRLWNYITLLGSMHAYEETGNQELASKFLDHLDSVWEHHLTNDDRHWLEENAFNEAFAWSDENFERQFKKVLAIIKNLDKPVPVYEPLTEQLPLFKD